MKYLAAVLTLCVMSGCAAKKVKVPVPNMDIPRGCVLGAKLNAKACEPISADLAVCHDVIVKFACIEVKK